MVDFDDDHALENTGLFMVEEGMCSLLSPRRFLYFLPHSTALPRGAIVMASNPQMRFRCHSTSCRMRYIAADNISKLVENAKESERDDVKSALVRLGIHC